VKKSTCILLALSAFAFACPQRTHADEVNDLIESILESSPTERAKVKSYEASKPKKKATAKKATPSGGSQSRGPDMGIPDELILDPSAKFPKDIVGKYIAGPVTLRSIFNQNGEAEIHLSAKNMRSFMLYTRDPDVVAAFDGGWGAKYTIPLECPLRIVGIKMPGQYSVRLPYDPDTTAYTIQEHFQKGTQGIFNDFQERMKRATENFQDSVEGR
jgi:hypothetical protein